MSHFSDILIATLFGMLLEGFLNEMVKEAPPPKTGFEQAQILREQELEQYQNYEWSPNHE